MGEKKYPAMILHINGDRAYLHFVPAEKHPGFQAAGDLASLGEVKFRQEGHGDF